MCCPNGKLLVIQKKKRKKKSIVIYQVRCPFMSFFHHRVSNQTLASTLISDNWRPVPEPRIPHCDLSMPSLC